MTKKHERSLARKAALQVLYSAELSGEVPSSIIEADLISPEVTKFSNYAKEVVCGVEDNRAEIDAHILSASENWAIDRMPVVDRCVLRIAVYEIYYVDRVPTSVAINEAVDLAKEFGGEDESGRFVNGILGKISKVAGGGAVSEVGDGAGADADASVAADAEVSAAGVARESATKGE